MAEHKNATSNNDRRPRTCMMLVVAATIVGRQVRKPTLISLHGHRIHQDSSEVMVSPTNHYLTIITNYTNQKDFRYTRFSHIEYRKVQTIDSDNAGYHSHSN